MVTTPAATVDKAKKQKLSSVEKNESAKIWSTPHGESNSKTETVDIPFHVSSSSLWKGNFHYSL
jgi:hypothetical protein